MKSVNHITNPTTPKYNAKDIAKLIFKQSKARYYIVY